MHSNANCGHALGIQYEIGVDPSVISLRYIVILKSYRHVCIRITHKADTGALSSRKLRRVGGRPSKQAETLLTACSVYSSP
jgi:hypothetical protein